MRGLRALVHPVVARPRHRLIQLIDAAPADRINDVAGEFLSGIRQALDA
jgi:hypothetical protein